MLDKPINLYVMNGARIDWKATAERVKRLATAAESDPAWAARRAAYNMNRLKTIARKYGSQYIAIKKIQGVNHE